MAITEDDKVRSRHHLGYLQVQEAQTFVLGVPAGVQTQFMIEGAFNRILPQAEKKFHQLLDILDGVECQIVENQENLAAEQVDEIKINLEEFKMLLRRYDYWRSALANLMGIQPNPFDQRFASWQGSSGINVPVNH